MSKKNESENGIETDDFKKEIEALSQIVNALADLDWHSRKRVMGAVRILLEMPNIDEAKAYAAQKVFHDNWY